ncbi:MAG TPA: GNAT family N-acetyltransferase [Tepidisphaeraceae bacterium]|jgi:ribosomal protein S18 acetylase RimI-like enzyme|nr:GNAT family N-acetyltransferase [Tepidisphaeraceae bacterium]
MAMRVDAATTDDVPRMAKLLGMLFAQEHEFSADQSAQERGLRMILEKPEMGRLLVLRQEDRIIGVANLLFTISTALGGRVAILDDFVVDPANRGQGGGSMLLTGAIESARQAGCLRITLNTDHDNAAAQRLYQRHGFEISTMKSMRRML